MASFPLFRFRCVDYDRLFDAWEGDLECIGYLQSGEILLRITSGCTFYVFVRTFDHGFSICIHEWGITAKLPDFHDFHVILYTLIDLLGLVDGRTVAIGLKTAYENGCF